MKKIIFLAGIFVIILAGCENKNAFTLTGTLGSGDMDGKFAYLLQLDSNLRIGSAIDSVKIEKSKFVFKGIAQEPPLVRFIAVGESRRAVDLAIIEKGLIEFNIDAKMQATVKGTEINEQYNLFRKNIAEKGSGGDIIYDFIKSNITNQLGQFYLLQAQFNLSDRQLKELISLPTSDFRKIQSVLNLGKRIDVREATAAGKRFTDVKGLNFDGKEVKLSDYAGKGKIVLIDFWASWCGPCIADMPGVIELYQKYKNKGFEIFGISLDSSKENWKKSTDDLKITWPQFSNLKGWEEDGAVAYGVNSIPHTVLIDKDGIIIERGLRGDALKNKLEGLFGGK